MISVTWKTREGKTKVITTSETETAHAIQRMLASEGIGSTRCNLITKMVHYEHVVSEGMMVRYEGKPYYVRAVIPGIPLVFINANRYADMYAPTTREVHADKVTLV